jgi:hypothetical protein
VPGYHTRKERRQAKHIIASERRRGVSTKRATSIGWATVNKRRHKRR